MRLDKYLADMGFISRKDAKQIIKNKRVKVNGNIVVKSDFNVNLTDKVLVDDEIIDYVEFEYIILNKPSGYVSANTDNKYPTVLELVNSRRKDLFIVGRLDLDTEGLLLITNDGELSHRLISPKYHVNKKYYVELEFPLVSNAKEILEAPMELDDFITKGSVFEKINETSAYLSIHEGKYHQVKRMFEKINNKVTYLKRVEFSFLNLDNLEISKWRYLSQEEINKLKKEVSLDVKGE